MPITEEQLLDFFGVQPASTETQLLNRVVPLTEQELDQVRHSASGDPATVFRVNTFEQRQNEQLAEDERVKPRLQDQLLRPQLSELSGLNDLELIRNPRNLIPRA